MPPERTQPPQTPQNLPPLGGPRATAGPQNLPPPAEPGSVTPPATASQPTSIPQAQPPASPQDPGQPQPNESGQISSASDQAEAEKAKQELRDAIKDSNEVLATGTTIMPFFYETYTIDRAKLTVSKRTFFGSAEVMSIRMEDVLNASAAVGPIVGSVTITNRVAGQSTSTIGPFWRADALRLKRVTQGYVIALQKNIDISALSANELEHMLERLGEDDHPATNTNEPAA